jgi:hypothetical protein
MKNMPVSKWIGLVFVSCISIGFVVYKVVFTDISPSIFTIPQEKDIRVGAVHNMSAIEGSFTARENGLGIIYLTSQIKRYIRTETLTFKLKTGTDKTWTYIQKIPELDFYFIQPFPIGFPVLSHSKNERIYFELSNEEIARPLFKSTAIAIQTKYKISLGSVVKNSESLRAYIRYKLLFALHDKTLYLFCIVGLIPLAFYLSLLIYPTWFRYVSLWLIKTKSKWHIALGAMIGFDIFVLPFKELYIPVLIALLAIIALLIRKKILSLRLLTGGAFLLLITDMVLLDFDYAQFANKAAGWFFICGTIICVILLISGSKKIVKK